MAHQPVPMPDVRHLLPDPPTLEETEEARRVFLVRVHARVVLARRGPTNPGGVL